MPTLGGRAANPADRRATDCASRDAGLFKQHREWVSSDRDTTSSRVALWAGNHDPDESPTLSKKRWFILFAVCVLGLASTLSGDISSVLILLLELLDLKVDQYIYLLQIYHYLKAALVVPTAMFADRFGIRISIHACLCFFVLDGILKVLLYLTELPGWSHYKMACYLLSCSLGVQRDALFVLMPLKVAETWFAKSERSVAWTLMISPASLGACITSTLYPRVIRAIKDFSYLALVNVLSISVATITCVACVTRSEPDTPPSRRMAAAAENKEPFWPSVKRMLGQKDILLHQLHFAISTSLVLTQGSVLQDILKSVGFSSLFTGNYLTLNALISIVMLVLMASNVHKVRNATLACKLSSAGRSSLFVCSIATLILLSPGYVIMGVSIAASVFNSWSSPHFADMMAHLACGTVSQATFVGFAILFTELTCSLVQVTFARLIEKRPDGTSDYHTALVFLVFVCAVDEAIYLTLFTGRQAARLAGRGQAEAQIQGSNTNPHDLRDIRNDAHDPKADLEGPAA